MKKLNTAATEPGGRRAVAAAPDDPQPGAVSRGLLRLLWPLALLFGLALAAANVVLGNLNHDEGWYLLTALRTTRGQWPYRDFLFTQGPVMPVVYGFLSPLWAPFGLLGGRVLTALLGLAASAVAAQLAARLAPRARRSEAALGAWLLTACVPVHSYFTAIPKTYSLAATLLMAGFLQLTRCGLGTAALSGVLLGLAAATRVSVGLALPVVGLLLLARRRDPAWRGAWFAFGVGGAAALALTYGMFWIRYGEAFAFAQGYHAVRDAGGPGAWLALRIGFLSRALQAYPLPWLLAAGLSLVCGPGFSRSLSTSDSTPRAPLVRTAAIGTVLAVTFLHAISPFPYDDYQTPVMPLLAAAVAAGLWQCLDPAPARVSRLVPLLLCAATLLLAAASPLLMDWIVIRKDRFWFERKPAPDLFVLREAGRWVRDNVPSGALLLTQDAYLAVEARRDVPDGLEMGPFSIFPDLPDAQARRHHVHTPATLRGLIATTDAPVAATSGYAFAVACPGATPMPDPERISLLETLGRFYEPVREVSDFGQAHTTLTLWRRRPAPLPPATPRTVNGGQ